MFDLHTSSKSKTLRPKGRRLSCSGPAGEHCTMILGEGKNPTLTHLVKLAEISGIKKTLALSIIEEVRQAVANWVGYATESGMSKVSKTMIQTALNHVGSQLRV